MTAAAQAPKQRRSKHTYCYDPSRFEKIMFWSLLPATVILPVWLVSGRTVMGGPSGWGSIFLVVTWAPVLFLYHILLLAITIVKNHRRWNNKLQRKSSSSSSCSAEKRFWAMMPMTEYFIAEQSATILAIYYVVSVLVQLFMMDGDEHCSVSSILTQWLGMSDRRSSDIGWLLCLACLALAVELLFLAIVEPLPGEPRKAIIKKTKAVVSRMFLAGMYPLFC